MACHNLDILISYNKEALVISSEHTHITSNMDSEHSSDNHTTCLKHCRPHTFWCGDCKEFTCNKCIASDHKFCDYCVIEEAGPNIANDIQDNIDALKLTLEPIRERLDDSYNNATAELFAVKEFVTVIEEMQGRMAEVVKKLDESIKEKTTDIHRLSQMTKDIEINCANGEDGVWAIHSIAGQVENMDIKTDIPENEDEDALLCHISMVCKVRIFIPITSLTIGFFQSTLIYDITNKNFPLHL